MIQQPKNVSTNALSEWSSVVQTGMVEHAPAFQPPVQLHPFPSIIDRKDWLDEEYREGYMEACVEQNIAWQIKFNREHRGITQVKLSEMIGSRQSVISRIEDPSYGKTNIGTLLKIANALKCAISIKLISFSELAEESKNFNKKNLIVKSFDDEIKLIKRVYDEKI